MLKGLDLVHAEVRKFHETFNHPISERPTMLKEARLRQRNVWVMEELAESLEATDVIGQADAMIDAIYFLMGTLVEMGVKPQAIFEIVQRANMAKVFPDGKPHFNEVGKVIKPQGWIAPEPKIEEEIKKQSAKYKIGDRFRESQEGDSVYYTTIVDVLGTDSDGDITYVVKVEHSDFGEPEHYYTTTIEKTLGFEEFLGQ